MGNSSLAHCLFKYISSVSRTVIGVSIYFLSGNHLRIRRFVHYKKKLSNFILDSCGNTQFIMANMNKMKLTIIDLEVVGKTREAKYFIGAGGNHNFPLWVTKLRRQKIANSVISR